MIAGDGIGNSIIAGGKKVGGGRKTLNRETVVRNTTGPQNQQDVALRSSFDCTVFYQCSFEGYQDTLYVHLRRRYFRECDIYRIVDIIFGSASVVIQNCNIYVRKTPKKTNTLTARGRKYPWLRTGIAYRNCRVKTASDLKPI
ncbi:hypothetical protein Tsubulata_007010 [Turnera subulata]|uniref:Pectinesterase catalytic domain-containing protein n=1 Tax=Turnera subulata TaxID=218843 RepID=A0A9Q0IZI4_9ROSI|nr:hypothetical protein Tsubulata_007010 [Turnera subulata]